MRIKARLAISGSILFMKKREETSRSATFGRTGRGELGVGCSGWLDGWWLLTDSEAEHLLH